MKNRFSMRTGRSLSALAGTVILVVLLGGCGGGGGSNPKPPPPKPQVSAAKSTITAVPASVTADGRAAAAITVTLKDTKGQPFTGSASVDISADPCASCTLHYTNDNGQVTGTLKSAVAGDITLSFTVNGTASPNTATVHFVAVPQVSAAKSTITAVPASVTADGKAAAAVTVTLRDTKGQPFTGSAKVNINADPCTICTLHYTNDNGRVTGTLKSEAAEDITLSFAVNGTKSPSTATVHFVALPPPATHSLAGAVVSGGRPVDGATVKVWAASPTPHAPATLLGVGQTDASGKFKVGFDSVPGTGQVVYAVASGGDAGAGVNDAIRLATIAGRFCRGSDCGFSSTVTINPLTSVATAYSLEGYTDLSGGTVNISGPASGPGLINAVVTFATLVNAASGKVAVSGASTVLCIGGDDEPDNCDALRKLNTLANFVAACTASAGPGSTACSGLLAGAGSVTDTFAALFHIATQPALRSAGAGVYELVPAPATAYSPALTRAPNDWSLALVYTGGGMRSARNVAVDAEGNVWVTNYIPSDPPATPHGKVSKFAPDGTALSPPTGFTGGGLSGSAGLAIDGNGNVWIGNWNGGNGTIVTELAPDGTPVAAQGYTISGTSPGPYGVAIAKDGTVWVADFGNSSLTHLDASGTEIAQYRGGGISLPISIAVDALGDVWIANQAGLSVSEFAPGAATWLSPAAGYTGGGLNEPDSLALDADGNVWVPNFFGPHYPANGSAVTELVGGNTPPATCPRHPGPGDTGCPLSPVDGFMGGGLYAASIAAVDSAGHIFISNYHGNSLTELATADGSALSPANGYRNPGINLPEGVAIDASGNLWMVSSAPPKLVKFIGIAAPVKTPLSGLPIAP